MLRMRVRFEAKPPLVSTSRHDSFVYVVTVILFYWRGLLVRNIWNVRCGHTRLTKCKPFIQYDSTVSFTTSNIVIIVRYFPSKLTRCRSPYKTMEVAKFSPPPITIIRIYNPKQRAGQPYGTALACKLNTRRDLRPGLDWFLLGNLPTPRLSSRATLGTPTPCPAFSLSLCPSLAPLSPSYPSSSFCPYSHPTTLHFFFSLHLSFSSLFHVPTA